MGWERTEEELGSLPKNAWAGWGEASARWQEGQLCQQELFLGSS